MGLILLIAGDSHAATVAENTLAAWDKEVQTAKQQLVDECRGADRFVYIREQEGERDNGSFYQNSADAQVAGKIVAVPSGLIHHWTGTVFIPGARAFDVLAVLKDYDSYVELYAPALVDSKLLSQSQNEFTYRLKFVQKEFGIKSGLLGTFRTIYHQSIAGSGYSVTEPIQLVELQNPGSAAEGPMSVSESRGYVQRTFSIVRYKEFNGGVLVELESLTLSRGLPASIRWLVTPVIQRLSRQTMALALQRLRDHVEATQSLASGSGQ